MSPIETLRQSYLSPEKHPPHWRTDLSNDDYHALKTHVSSSSIRKFPESGKSFYWAFSSSDEPKECQEFGTAFHQAILEPDAFEKLHVIAPDFTKLYGHGNTKVHKEAKARWMEENAGKTILTPKRFDDMRWMLDSLRSHPDAVMLMKHGVAERSGFFHDPETGIPCRIRPDWLNGKLSCLVDIKTTSKDISKRVYAKTINKERYDISLAMYAEGEEIISGKPIMDSAIIALQTVKPYECAVYPLTKRAMSLGQMDYHVALSDLAEALKTNQWKPAQRRMEEIEHPQSAFREYAV